MGELASLLQRALSERAAVAAFNAVDPASMSGILRSREVHRSPVVVQVSERAARRWGPFALVHLFATLQKRWEADAVLHLDHCRSPELALECLHAGWHSVLFDVSLMPFDEGVECTRRVVEVARDLGADVEGEFDAIALVDRDGRPQRSDPLQCQEFVERTGVTCLAPAVGTVHGRTAIASEIDHGLVRDIARVAGVPLVLHGGTGVPLDSVRRAVRAGVAKVNISTELKEVYLGAFATRTAACVDPLELLDAVSLDVSSLVTRWTRSLW